MSDVGSDINGYSSYLKSQGVSDEDIHGYTKYLADQHGIDHPADAPAGQETTWKDHVRPWLNALPTAGMIGGGAAAGAAGFALPVPGGAAVGTAIGSGLGAAGGEALKNLGEKYILGEDKTRAEIYGNPAKGFVDGVSAEMGGQVIGKGIDSAPGAVKWATQKVGKIFASVPEETTARYIENPSAINSAPSSKDISERVMAMKDAADKHVVDAHEELSNAKQQMADAKLDARSGIQDQKFQAGNELNEAQANFNEKKQQFKETLKSNNLTGMAADVHSSVADLKDKVIQGSKDAFDILEKSDGAVGVDPLIKDLQGHIESMKINGVPRNQTAAQSIEELRAMQRRLFEMTKETGGKLSMPQAKQMMQGLDRDLPYSGQPGSFAAPTEQAFKDLRGNIDTSVKTQSDPYKQKMLEVSSQTQLLKRANDLYGTPEKAISNLNNIDSEKGQAIHAPLLNQLSKITGHDLSSSVDGYLYNQKVLKTPSLFDKLVEGTPEAKALMATRAKAAEISDPEFSRSVTEKATAPIQKRIEAAESSLNSSKGNQKDFSGITSDSITGKQKQLTGANSYGAENRWRNIDQKYGTNFENEIRARNDADQFAKDDTRGSRKTLLGGALGALIGHLSGEPFGLEVGATIGGSAGSAADKYSGPVFKSTLDAGMKLSGPAKATAAAVKEAPAAIGSIVSPKIEAASALKAADNDRPEKGPAKWANDGVQALMQHAQGKDRDLIAQNSKELLADEKGRDLLIKASDLKPGSKAMNNLLDRVKAHLKGD